jgi:hypothetical protein
LPPAWPLRRGISLDGAEIELEKAAIKELGNAMTGPVMLSGHPDYDGARKIWNGMHDKRPALIARCQNVEDICHAVDFARERSLLLAVRGRANEACCLPFGAVVIAGPANRPATTA